jgi:hypothetical protein
MQWMGHKLHFAEADLRPHTEPILTARKDHD